MQVILASESPRRRQLLKDAGVKFMTMPAQADETLSEEEAANPSQAARTLADRKAGSVVQQLLAASEMVTEPVAVIGADTMVVFQGKIFGKPRSYTQGKDMLMQLQGATHEVITGVSVWMLQPGDDGQISVGRRAFSETSEVTFKPQTEEQIAAYLRLGESFDKAGAYAIQGEGANLVEHYEGDYDNIVGLPVSTLLQLVPGLAE